jgi:putative sigma-54 modulation protein
MNIKIESINFKADTKLREFITEKIEKLSNYHDSVLKSEVILKVDKNDKSFNKITEIKTSVKGEDFFVKKQSKTFEESTDIAVEALRRQLRKHKGKTETNYRK